MRHILFITPGFPSGVQDSHVVTYFANFIKYLKKEYSETQISIITLEYPFLDTSYIWENTQVHSISKKKHTFINKPTLWTKTIRKARQLHAQSPISSIHAVWYREATFLAQCIGYMIRRPVVSTVMGTELIGTNYYQNLIRPKYLKLVAVSDIIQRLIKDKTGNDSTVISWGVPSKYSHVEFKQNRPYDLLFVGFINSWKDLPLFLKIVAKSIQGFPNIKVLIIGEEYEKGYVEKLIGNHRLQKNCTFLGRLQNQEVLSYMRQSKILVHTALFESQGYVFLEALAMGMNIISKKVGIAKIHPKWRIATTMEDYVDHIDEWLSGDLSFESYVPFPIEKTIQSYISLYDA